MEDNKEKETYSIKKNGAITKGTILLVGYVLGRICANQIAVEAYKRGVSDALNSMIFRH